MRATFAQQFTEGSALREIVYDPTMQVDVSAKTVSFPRHCACCGREPDAQLALSASRSRGVRVVRTTTHTWSVPYCSACIRHTQEWERATTYLTVALAVGAVVGALLLCSSAVVGIVIFTLALAAGLGAYTLQRKHARTFCSTGCAMPGRAASFLGWDGTLQSFWFAHPSFATAFMIANLNKLVNLTPQTRQLLEAGLAEKHARAHAEMSEKHARARAEIEARHARVQADLAEKHARIQSELDQRHAAAATAAAQAKQALDDARQRAASAREDDLFVGVITRIEKASGPAARRAAIEAGMRALQRQDLRDKLLLEASKIEVQAALEKRMISSRSPRSYARSGQRSMASWLILSRTNCSAIKSSGSNKQSQRLSAANDGLPWRACARISRGSETFDSEPRRCVCLPDAPGDCTGGFEYGDRCRTPCFSLRKPMRVGARRGTTDHSTHLPALLLARTRKLSWASAER
jgi:hypothetical protein